MELSKFSLFVDDSYIKIKLLANLYYYADDSRTSSTFTSSAN